MNCWYSMYYCNLNALQHLWLTNTENQNHHDANFVVTGGTRGCHNDNIRCHKLRQCWYLWQLYRHMWHQKLSGRQPPVRAISDDKDIMTTLLSLVALEVVITTTSDAIHDEKVGIMTTLVSRCTLGLGDARVVHVQNSTGAELDCVILLCPCYFLHVLNEIPHQSLRSFISSYVFFYASCT